MTDTTKTAATDSAGIWYGVLAFSAWGVLPLYWKLLDIIPAQELLAHRIFWSFLLTAVILLITGGWQTLIAVLGDRRKLVFVFLCGFLISLNWFTYIYAINTNHVIDASMGYYINPLVVVLLGITVLKEKPTRWQVFSIIVAAAGVLFITVQHGKLPWIALLLALTFALYGLTKKIIKVDSITGLTLETFIVMPVALIYIVGMEIKGVGALGTLPLTTILILAGTGIITSAPLLLYARGVQETTFSMMGFLQFIAPTIKLLLGIFVFKEYFSVSHLISFCFIWVALIIFTLAKLGVLKEYRQPDARHQVDQ